MGGAPLPACLARALLAAPALWLPAAGADVAGDPAAVQGKFDVTGWVADASAQAGSISSGIADNLAKAGNATMPIMGQAAAQGKLLALKAVLWSLGSCPSFYAALGRVPATAAPRLAAAFQEQKASPAEGKAFCQQAAMAGLDSAIDHHMANRTSAEKTVVKWSISDRLDRICSDDLLRSLGIMECIRVFYPAAYREAVTNKLLLDVFTLELLTTEVDKVCGGDTRGEDEDVSLFSDGGVAEPAGPAWRTYAGAAASGSAGLLLVLLAAAAAWRAIPRGRSAASIVSQAQPDAEGGGGRFVE